MVKGVSKGSTGLLYRLGRTARTDDFEVIGLEHNTDVESRGLRLNLRVDRVDRITTPTGHAVLMINYKTGSRVQPTDWEPHMLTAPQLPLYATTPFKCGEMHYQADC